MLLNIALTFVWITAVTGTPPVTAVYPSGPVISDHTLRVSIEFASPQESPILPRLSLRNQDHSMLTGAFLEQELWSPNRKQLTILFDPGRLKTDLGRQRTLGAPLEGQSNITLSLDETVIKSWSVEHSRCRAIAVSEWQILLPHSGRVTPLSVTFPEPIDFQARHLIAVVDSTGRRVKGNEALTDFERKWTFTPERSWSSGTYRLLIHPDLENPCGDQIGDAFEHSIQDAPPLTLSRTFRISGN